MSLRFAVLVHDDAEMLRKLALRLMPYPVFVHLDAALDIDDFLASADGDMPPNVEFIERRFKVYWGGYSVVRAMIACAEASMQMAEDSDHVLFLSGHCYPLRPIEDLLQKLRSNTEAQFVRAYRLRDYSGWHTDRFMKRHWFDISWPGKSAPRSRRLVRNGLKKISSLLPAKTTALDVVAGSQWMALTVECLREALHAVQSEPYDIFKNSFAPDEMAIQTFIYNSRWIEQTQAGAAESLLAQDVSSLPNLHYLRAGVSGLATTEDAAQAMRAGAYFIRKLESHKSSSVISMIDAALDQPSDRPSS